MRNPFGVDIWADMHDPYCDQLGWLNTKIFASKIIWFVFASGCHLLYFVFMHCSDVGVSLDRSWLRVRDNRLFRCLLLYVDLRVGSIKSTWAFQVGSSWSVAASPSKFSGSSVSLQVISSRLEKSTWQVFLHLPVLSNAAIDEFGQIRQFVTYFSNPI